MESTNVQKQRKIIMKVNGEKKEILFNDEDKGPIPLSIKSSSSKRKSEDRSQSPLKRKKSSERSSTSSKHKSLKEDKTIDKSSKESESKKSEKSSSGSSKHKSSNKSSKDEKSSKKSSSENKPSSTAQKSAEKQKSSNQTNSLSAYKIPKVAKDDSTTTKQKSSSSSKNVVLEKSTTDSKSSSEAEQKHSESSSSKEKPSKSKDKSLDQGSSSSSKDKSSKSKDKSSDRSSASSSKHKSSSKSEKTSLPSSKRSKSSEKSSSSQSKRKKSSNQSKNENKEQKGLTENQTELIKQEMGKMIEESMKKFTAMFDQIREETKKVVENVLKSRESLSNEQNSIAPKPVCDDQSDPVKEKHSDAQKSISDDCPEKFKHPYSIVPEYYYADRHDLTDMMKRRLAIINAPPLENYPDEDYDYICIGGEFVPKCKFDYFVDPMDNILKFRKVADFSHLAEPFEDPNFEKSHKLVPNTEIPLDEINNLRQTDSNKNIKMESIKSEKVEDDEVLTKPVPVFSTSITQPLPDSKENIQINTVKSEPQPHCSKYIPPTKIKQEFSIDSSEYFRVIPQNSTNSEIPVIEDSEKLKTLADMSLINKWIASQNKNHGFKDKEALNLMMSKNSLFSLFKCMGINCCYTTVSSSNFLDHLNIHMEENDSIKDCFLNCAYCLEKLTGPTDLIEHYKDIHSNCTYQCNLCFYRAAEQQSVYDHQAHYHSQDPRKRVIFDCPNVFPKDEKVEEQKVINKVKDIKECISCELCFEEFILPEDCIKHLKSNHQSAEEKNKAEEQVQKMYVNFTNNIIGKYQCLECDSTKPFGSNSRIEMRTHLHHHPKSLHYVCVRETDQYKHMRIKSRGDLQTIKYKGNLEILKNDEGILKLTTV